MKRSLYFAMLLALSPETVFACTPPPPPEVPARRSGETLRAYNVRADAAYKLEIQQRANQSQTEESLRQARLFNSASQIIVVEATQFTQVPFISNGTNYGSVTSLVVTPRVWLKGRGPNAPLRLTNFMTSCGPRGNAKANRVGEWIVLFAPAGPLQDS